MPRELIPPEMTHDRLVKAAKRWLLGSRRCWLAVTEFGNGSEIPDALGWRYRSGSLYESILIECKTNRADFFADAKKRHRQGTNGIGELRWYLTPPGLVKKHEVPEGWGLMVCRFYRSYGSWATRLESAVRPVRREPSSRMLREERKVLVAVGRNALSAVSKVKFFGVRGG